MNKQMKNRENLGKKVMSQLIEEVMYGWPPDCMGILYQPERPQHKCGVDSPNDNSAEDKE